MYREREREREREKEIVAKPAETITMILHIFVIRRDSGLNHVIYYAQSLDLDFPSSMFNVSTRIGFPSLF
jgi:hypothetical protein